MIQRAETIPPTTEQLERRPLVWIGHVSLEVSNFKQSLAFFQFIGMRKVTQMPGLAILELRGGTHLILSKKIITRPDKANFDLMVDDLNAQHEALIKAGYAPKPIKKGMIHNTFEIVEPSGHTVTFSDSHVAGPV